MQAVEAKRFHEDKLPGSRVTVEGEVCNFQLHVISDELSGLSPVTRHQSRYAHLNPEPKRTGKLRSPKIIWLILLNQ